jgi:hypothetical protein
MAYTKTYPGGFLNDNTTPVTAASLNNMEDAIVSLDTGLGTISAWTTTAASGPVAVGARVFVDTSGGSVTLDLPASAGLTMGDSVQVADLTGSFGTNLLKLQADGTDPLMGVAGDFLDLSTNYDFLTLTWSDGTNGWVITSKP